MKKSGKNKFLLDGFPRDKENVDEWHKTMEDQYHIQFVLVFDCDEKTSLTRCLERGKESHRTDDNEESLKKR
jgi:UMP-CMP kinase